MLCMTIIYIEIMCIKFRLMVFFFQIILLFFYDLNYSLFIIHIYNQILEQLNSLINKFKNGQEGE